MIVTPQKDRRNRRFSLFCSGVVVALVALIGRVEPWALAAAPLALGVWSCRRRILRRKRIVAQPFPAAWEAVLSSRVVYYGALDATEKERFRKLVRIFLDEVRVTGVRTEVDDVVLALVGASAVIPIFGFPDWEYARLGEVLIYPGSFDEEYRTEGGSERAILGMVGLGSLRGVMILSKPDLIGGFERLDDRFNAGLHEFAHLVDVADGRMDGLPPGVPRDLARQWVAYVAAELRNPPDTSGHITPYGYTDEAEHFAVVSEYFFERPSKLEEKDPALYRHLERMFRQDTRTRLAGVRLPRKRKIRRNAPCPCESGRKYKHCCLGKRLLGLRKSRQSASAGP